MPKELDECVNALMNDPDFKPEKGKSKKESAFAICNAKLKDKSSELDLNKFNFNFSIKKADKKERIIEGYANIEEIDRHGELIVKEAFTEALNEYMDNPILRYMHYEEPIGKVIESYVDKIGLFVKAKIVDSPNVPIANKAWDLIEAGVLKAFSIGGSVKERELDKETGIVKILKLWLAEISVVDIPANKNSFFTVVKNLSKDEVIFLNKKEQEEKQKKELIEDKKEEEQEEPEEKEQEDSEEETDNETEKNDFIEFKKQFSVMKKKLDALEKSRDADIKKAMVEVLKKVAEAKKKSIQTSDKKEMTQEEIQKKEEETVAKFFSDGENSKVDFDY